MSTCTAPQVVAVPVTPDTLVDLLKQARAYLHDAPRTGQVLGMRIDEALARWHECTFGTIVCNVGGIEIKQFDAVSPGAIVVWPPEKPVTFKDIPWAGQAPEVVP